MPLRFWEKTVQMRLHRPLYQTGEPYIAVDLSMRASEARTLLLPKSGEPSGICTLTATTGDNLIDNPPLTPNVPA